MSFARRLMALSAMALAIATFFPVGVAASSATAMTLSDTCSTSGGAWGSGYLALKVQARERDLAGVTQIRLTASLMHQARTGSATWALHQTQQRTGRSFRDTTRAHSLTWTAIWNLGGDSATYRHRIEVSAWFVGANGAVYATRTVVGRAC